VLDGEVAIFDRQLWSRFEWLRDPDLRAVAAPPVLIAFDMLYSSGRDLSKLPLRERRERLEEVVAGDDVILPVRRLAPNGLEAWAQVLDHGYEGWVGKDEAIRGRHSLVVEGEGAGLDGSRRPWKRVRLIDSR
jgi:bifunctional non-homologous end joining protein LigD